MDHYAKLSFFSLFYRQGNWVFGKLSNFMSHR
jgi:hypothetical protein